MTDRARRAPWGVCREGANPAPGLPAPAPPPNPALCGVVIRHVDFRGAAPSWGLWGAVPSCGTRVLQAAPVWALRRGVTIFSEGPGSFRGRGVTNKDPGAGCAYGSETGISLRPRRTEQGGACPRAHPCRRTCLCTCLCANACAHQPDPCPPTSEALTRCCAHPAGRVSSPVWESPPQQREARRLRSLLASSFVRCRCTCTWGRT